MNIRQIIVASVLVLGGCGGGGDSGTGPTPPIVTPPPPPPPPPPATSAAVEASASANVFSPQEVTIGVGRTVTWTFGARPHNVAFGSTQGAPADIPTTTNAQVSRTFNTAGVFPYECTLHPGMTGSVKVQ